MDRHDRYLLCAAVSQESLCRRGDGGQPLSPENSGIHPDLLKKDSAGFGPLGLGIACAAFSWGLVVLDLKGGRQTWSKISSGVAQKTWGIGDWVGEVLVFLILLLVTLAFILGSVGGFAVWIWSLVWKLSDDDRAWRLKATSVEATAVAQAGRIKVTKLRSGGVGPHSAGPSFFFFFEVVALGDGNPVSACQSFLVRQAADIGPVLYSRKLSEFSKSDSLLNQLIQRNVATAGVADPKSRQGKEYTSVVIPAALKMDSAETPRIVIAEADGTRIWCSAAGTYPGEVYRPDARGAD